jgi:hypothetical protein
MSISIGSMSAAQITEKILDLPEPERSKTIAALEVAAAEKMQAQAAVERKKVAIERIAAAKADGAGGKATIDLLNGTLHRGGMPSVEKLAEQSPDQIMKLFSESSMASADKMACKSTLHKLRVID